MSRRKRGFVAVIRIFAVTIYGCSHSQTSGSAVPSSVRAPVVEAFLPVMLSVPSGSYTMGDLQGDGRPNESPPQRVEIQQSFDISQSPVTVAQYRAFVVKTGYTTRAESDAEHGCWGVRADLTIGWLPAENWQNNRLNQAEDHPVVCINWQDAMQYIAWLSARTGDHYRLPTEREWEYAARGGSQEKYYYGSSVDRVCEHINHADFQMIKAWNADTEVSTCDDGYLTTSPVGHYPKNGFGLFDAYGNVWEWVSDCYTTTLQEASASPASVAPEDCQERTLRGASWASQTKGTTTSYRNNGDPEVPTVDYGFRLVREKRSVTGLAQSSPILPGIQ